MYVLNKTSDGASNYVQQKIKEIKNIIYITTLYLC